MRKFLFRLDNISTVIIVQAEFKVYKIRLALDTAASQTVVDWNLLLILGYTQDDLREIVQVETANGIIDAWIVTLKNLNSLGLHRTNFPVLTYDFLAKGLFSPQDGVLGLDFFEDTVLTIDFREKLVWAS
jgi:hypothetical protein